MTPEQQVTEFHQTYGHPILQEPALVEERIHMRYALIAEEFAELTDALYGKGAGDFIRRSTNTAPRLDDHTRDLTETADALGDLAYVVYGMALECGIPLDRIITEIHRSNMSKLGVDGKPIYREDGKVLKGPDYSPPNLAPLLQESTNA